jgi:hypothetical protein
MGKRWAVDAYAANLLKRGVGNLVGVNLAVRFYRDAAWQLVQSKELHIYAEC